MLKNADKNEPIFDFIAKTCKCKSQLICFLEIDFIHIKYGDAASQAAFD